MLNRWIGITCTVCMLSVNTALFTRDVLPGWLAGEPPEFDAFKLAHNEKRHIQVGIFDERGLCVGRSWTVGQVFGDVFNVKCWTVLEPLRLPNVGKTAGIKVCTNVIYRRDGLVQVLKIQVFGQGLLATLSGEHVPPDDFICQWRVAEHVGNFILPARALRAFGDVIRPFDRLPNLYVGRAWRMELFDPLAQLLPGWRGRNISTDSLLVRVVALEEFAHQGQIVEVFRVEAAKMRAWVTRDGRVLKQEVEVPLLGSLSILDEAFDQQAYEQALR